MSSAKHNIWCFWLLGLAELQAISPSLLIWTLKTAYPVPEVIQETWIVCSFAYPWRKCRTAATWKYAVWAWAQEMGRELAKKFTKTAWHYISCCCIMYLPANRKERRYFYNWTVARLRKGVLKWNKKIAASLSSPVHIPLNRLPKFLVSVFARLITFVNTQKTSKFFGSGSVVFVFIKNLLTSGSTNTAAIPERTERKGVINGNI